MADPVAPAADTPTGATASPAAPAAPAPATPHPVAAKLAEGMDKVTTKVTEGGRSIFGGLWGFAKGLIASPFHTVIGAVTGAFSSIISIFWTSAAIFAAYTLMPGLVNSVANMVGGQKLVDKLSAWADPRRGGGMGTVIGMSLLSGTALAGGFGAINGAVNEIGNNSGGPDDRAGGLGGLIGGTATTAAIGALIVGALQDHGVTVADTGAPIAPRPSQPGHTRSAT